MIALTMTEQRASLIHEARSATDAGQAERIWGYVDQLESQLANSQKAAARPKIELDDSPECRAFENYIRQGERALDDGERRALAADMGSTGGYGGYLMTPQKIAEAVTATLDNLVAIRQLATVNQVDGAHSLGVPTVDTDIDDADWTSELGTGNEDSALKFGKRELYPWPLAKRVKSSAKLLHRAKNAVSLVVSRLAYKIGLAEEKAYLTGDGDKKPLGVFTASSYGISTGRDVSTGNAATSIGVDGLLNAYYSLKSQYLSSPSLRWIFSRAAVKQIRKLRADAVSAADAAGGYLLQPALQAGQPDLVLGVPVVLSEYAPATFTTGLYVGIIGDFAQYWICDAGGVQIQRLNELYAEAGQVGFIGRLETDGCPALEEAFARVKLA
jgi:HK97 family phage major capsid protein